MNTEIPAYSIAKTVTKTARPLLVILIVPAAKAALAAAGILIDDAMLFNITIAIYGGLIGLNNWIKNRKKGK